VICRTVSSPRHAVLQSRRAQEVYDDDPGRPPLSTRLMAGLSILKHTYLSDEMLCERWIENP